MGWDKLAGTGVATAQKFVQRPFTKIFSTYILLSEFYFHFSLKTDTFGNHQFQKSLQAERSKHILTWMQTKWNILQVKQTMRRAFVAQMILQMMKCNYKMENSQTNAPMHPLLVTFLGKMSKHFLRKNQTNAAIATLHPLRQVN